MKEKQVPIWKFSNELEGIILIGFSLVIFKLYISKKILIILEPEMLPFLLFAMVSLFIIGFFRILNSDLNGADCDCEVCDPSSSMGIIIMKSSLFILVIILSFVVNDFIDTVQVPFK
ncbi:DUF1980 domain-containing protein [Neobacillus massiliamazoniensis]|uniref:Nucleic acid binding domain protein n=1 Tax=Neobacillus massiliamazoniensis TaxID=1499688 RepID=A0A0U1NRX6_9BACI|nr:DUF1980 domain-containing protein [Neobacillus massiliamazoniensis]CRK80810.1 nucleic acid binding domain protein [Neobacillus massiliamazoniensis]